MMGPWHAFGGAKGFGRAYTVGKWFAIEALLLERRFNFDVRSLNFLECDFFSKKDLDEILLSPPTESASVFGYERSA